MRQMIQKFVYELLKANLTVPIFDYVPDDEDNFPFVVIGEDTVKEWGDDEDRESGEITVGISVWSRYSGKKELKSLMESICLILDLHDTEVYGYNIVVMYNEFSGTALNSDGITRNGLLRFRVLVEEADTLS